MLPIYLLLTGFLVFWSVWASSGMTVRRKLQIGMDPSSSCWNTKLAQLLGMNQEKDAFTRKLL